MAISDMGQFFGKQVAKLKVSLEILDGLDKIKEIKKLRYANGFLPMMDALSSNIVMIIDALLDKNFVKQHKGKIPSKASAILDALESKWKLTPHSHYRNKVYAHLVDRKESQTFNFVTSHGRMELELYISGLSEVVEIFGKESGQYWVTEWNDISSSFHLLTEDLEK